MRFVSAGAVSALTLALLLNACASKPEPPKVSAFVDAYYDALFAWSPSFGTSVGFHQYDNRLEDRSAAAYERRVAVLKDLLKQAEVLEAAKPAEQDQIDLTMIHNSIQAELLDLETIQTWRHNPIDYVASPGGAVDLLMKRDFAPAKERLAGVTARLVAAPALIAAMKANVTNPPKEFTDLAIRVAGGSIGFLEREVSAWAKDAAGGDAQAFSDFQKADTAVVAAMKDAAAWLKSDLLPRSNGAYAIGAENFSKKLLYEEMVDLPLDRVLAVGQANLDRDYTDFVETAKKINPKLSPADVMKSLEADHPAEADLLPAARRTIEGTRTFLIEHKIVTVPSDVRPRIEETPVYARVGSFASMDTPGPYEEKATEAFYYVTPPEMNWDAKHKEEHLRLYNKYVMQMITIHEAFPGHYLQFLYGKQFPTKTRKLSGAASNAEGWAHYAEQMMLEQGYGNGDPKIHLAQLSEALLRDCRYIAGIKLHTQGWTVEQGQKLFVEKGFQQPANAFEESRRGAYNPTYLYYTLGKLMIYKLRADYQQAKGSAYSLQGFHDEFVKQGPLPLKLMRQIMLPGNTAPLL
ncbi:DUF885 domain-containing protein [uncultured Paludibaculum sp.]|uniref:DUF885 domain-containing protein n=1 Tax=uncultured Paludibaculum sp. TaxID=1765020 RepID=UPI002AABB3CA|nr:DUF885 domain-containing protein [uncultured Paludibaculum sp.]